MASTLLISLRCVHRKLEHAVEEGGGGVDVKLPSWLPVALENSGGHSKVAIAHSWPQTPLALCEGARLCSLMSSLES